MNLYKKLLEEQEIKRLKHNKKTLQYYYNNREYVLNRQANKKIYHKQYYDIWYEKNKHIVQERRRNKKNKTIHNITQKVNYKNDYKKIINNNNIIIKEKQQKQKPVCFTIFFN